MGKLGRQGVKDKELSMITRLLTCTRHTKKGKTVLWPGFCFGALFYLGSMLGKVDSG